MGFKMKSVASFKNETSVGIDRVPLGSVIQVENYEGENKLFLLQGKSGLTSVSTIKQAVDNRNITVTSPSEFPRSSQLTGTYSLSNTVKTLGAGKFLYTGNGTSQEINIGVSSIDFTQSSNGTGYYHDRVAGDCIVKNDAGTIVESGEISFKDVTGVDGIIKAHIKGRSIISYHKVYDGIRGKGIALLTDTTSTEYVNSPNGYLNSFTTNGFSVTIGTADGVEDNQNGVTYVTYIELYTHIKWGLTSQGKRYIEAYNPVSNMGMIMYEGSGLAGHQIPHSLGVKIDYLEAKSLSNEENWLVDTQLTNRLVLNQTGGQAGDDPSIFNTSYIELNAHTNYNSNGATNVLYYKAKSSIWTCGIYNGTGVAGNFVPTNDYEGNACKPHELIVKTINGTSDWFIWDNKRGTGNRLSLNTTAIEIVTVLEFNNNGFTVGATTSGMNDSGDVNFYQASLIPSIYSTDLDGYFDNPTDTTNLQLADGLFSISNGYNTNGADNTLVSKSGTITVTNGWE